MTYEHFTEVQYKKLEKLGYNRIETSVGPRMIFDDGFCEIVLSYDGLEYEYDYSDLDHECDRVRVYQFFFQLHKRAKGA